MSSSSKLVWRTAALTILTVASTSSHLAAQTTAAVKPLTEQDLGNVVINVVVPAAGNALTVDQRNQIGDILLQAATANGVSGMGGPAGFELNPLVAVSSEGEAGKLQAFKYVRLNVTFAIRQRARNIAFGSTSVLLEGSGQNRDAAITSAIGNLSPDNEKLLALLESGKSRIVQYYQTNCDAIRADAKARAGTGKADEAIALLMSVPREASACQSASSEDAQKLYVVYRDRECEAAVRSARGDVANRQYDSATTKLERVDPASRCAKSADDLLSEISQRVAGDHTMELRVHGAITTRAVTEKTLTQPGGLVKHTREATASVAVGFVTKLGTTPHIIE